MNFWLLKTEPNDYSWEDMKKDTITQWTGVRNFEARNNMQKMQLNDLCFFYHTGKEKKLMGLVQIVKTYYKDPQDSNFGIVDVKYFISFNQTLSLTEIKINKDLQNMILVKRNRLSVLPITNFEANKILLLVGIDTSLLNLNLI